MHESMGSKSYLIDAAIEVLIPLAPTELHSARRTLQHTWKQVKNKSHHSLEFKKKMVFISWWWKLFFLPNVFFCSVCESDVTRMWPLSMTRETVLHSEAGTCQINTIVYIYASKICPPPPPKIFIVFRIRQLKMLLIEWCTA